MIRLFANQTGQIGVLPKAREKPAVITYFEITFTYNILLFGLSWWLSGKESACQCRRCEFDPGWGGYPGGGNGNLLQYSCLQNPPDRGAWWATVHGVAKESDIT